MAKLPAAAKTTKVKSPACFCCQNPRSNLFPFSSSTFGVMKEGRNGNGLYFTCIEVEGRRIAGHSLKRYPSVLRSFDHIEIER